MAALDLARLADTEANLQLARLRGVQAEAEQALTSIAYAGLNGWPALLDIPSSTRFDTAKIDTLLEQLPTLRAASSQIATARAAVELSRRERRAGQRRCHPDRTERSEHLSHQSCPTDIHCPSFCIGPSGLGRLAANRADQFGEPDSVIGTAMASRRTQHRGLPGANQTNVGYPHCCRRAARQPVAGLVRMACCQRKNGILAGIERLIPS